MKISVFSRTMGMMGALGVMGSSAEIQVGTRDLRQTAHAEMVKRRRIYFQPALRTVPITPITPITPISLRNFSVRIEKIGGRCIFPW